VVRKNEKKSPFNLSFGDSVTLYSTRTNAKPQNGNGKTMSTSPISGSREPLKEVGSKRVQRSSTGQSASVARGSEAKEAGPTSVADSVATTRRLIEVAQEEFSRADEKTIEELRMAIKEGRFKVDPERLASRLIADALGEVEGSKE
jgi:flagellar biosynthesis anti-sigma factor FlgM